MILEDDDQPKSTFRCPDCRDGPLIVAVDEEGAATLGHEAEEQHLLGHGLL